MFFDCTQTAGRATCGPQTNLTDAEAPNGILPKDAGKTPNGGGEIEMSDKDLSAAKPQTPAADTEAMDAASAYARSKQATGLRSMSAEFTRMVGDYLENEPEPGTLLWYRWFVATRLENKMIRWFFITIVCINAVLIGVQSDWGTEESENNWVILEACFVGVFMFEIGLKIFGFGMYFFLDGWNNMDFFIVGISLIELMVTLIADTSGNSGFSAFRLLRVLRIIRLINFLERLNLLVTAFLMALMDIIWVFMLVLMVIYVFAILANSFFGDSWRLDEAEGPGWSHSHFGTVARSMATLFQMMTLDSWMSGITRPVGNVYQPAFFFFVFFVGLASLGLLNLLTAIFVESLSQLTKDGAMEEAAAEEAQKARLGQLIEDVFKKFDEDGSGTLDREEIDKALIAFEEPMYAEMFAGVGMDLDDIKGAIELADPDGDGEISYTEFTQGIAQMDQQPLKKDTWEILSKTGSIEKRCTRLESKVDAILAALKVTWVPPAAAEDDEMA
jgi:voltage-gated sodium channel